MTDNSEHIESSEYDVFNEEELLSPVPEEFDRVVPEVTGASVHPWEGITDRDTGLGRLLENLQDQTGPDPAPTGGDVDSDQYLARVVGEEAIGGSTPTPDQNVVEDLAVAAGIEIPDTTALHTNTMLETRDSHRWELDPTSSEDYEERA
jgi:hypothetical protein